MANFYVRRISLTRRHFPHQRGTAMSTPDAPLRRMTTSRVIALIIVTLLAGALVVMASGGNSAVSVPRGAHAGQVFLHSCTYSTEAGKYPADCGTLVVPENRQNPTSRLIALPIKRVHSKSPHPGPPVFFLVGGPGITNMDFPIANRFTANHDVVVVGYRGVDGSVRLDCPEVQSALTGTSDLLAKTTLQAYSAAFRTCATRLTKSGVDLRGYNLVQRVDDMEAARTALGYKTLDLISESAGTRTAMIYSWRHPSSINRSIMLAVNPPGHYLYNGPMTDQQIRHYSQLCAADASCRSRTGDLSATMRSLSRNLPDRWGPFAIKPGNVKLATFFGLMDATSEAAPLSAPQTIDTWLSAEHGDNSGMWLLSLFGDMAIPTSHVWGDVPATGQIDNQVANAYYANGGDHGSILGNAFTDHLWGSGGLVGSWPHSAEVDQYTTLRPTNVPTLLISGDVDFATPAPFATEMLPSLRNGHQVVLHNLGHTEDTFDYDKPAFTQLVNTFFDTGRVDQSGYTPRATDFRASPTHSTIAKIVATSVSGLVVVAAILLVWLSLRLRRRGDVGVKTGVVARSIFALFVGLGGWCLGALVLLTLLPSVALSNEPVSVLFIAVPVALVVYIAWIHRSWPRSIRMAGLGAAAGGALVGTWAGLHAVSGLFAVFFAVFAAILGANLAVLLRDVIQGTPSAPPSDTSGYATASPIDGTRAEVLPVT